MVSDANLSTFVRQHIRSVWGLELLLLLRTDTARCWAPDDLVRELRASRMVVDDSLAKLEESSLAVRDDAGCWRYRPGPGPLDELCAQLQDAYRERPVRVINLISRPDPLQSLADAFKFRGGKEVMTSLAPAAIYLLCLATSATCAGLLLRAWKRSGTRLLLWTAVSFIFLALNNLCLVADKVLFPDSYLTPLRQLTAGVALVVLLYGFIWEVER